MWVNRPDISSIMSETDSIDVRVSILEILLDGVPAEPY